MSLSEKNAKESFIKTLQLGGLVIYPSDTCYGAGVDATNQSAVLKLLKYKKRPQGKAISVAVDSLGTASQYVKINKTAKNFYKEFLPGAYTIISESKKILPKELESENGTLGVRIPDSEFLQETLKKFKKPITATSANSSGKKTPYSIDDVLKNITKTQKNLIDLIIDGGNLPLVPTSTVIDTTTTELTTYRKGKIDLNKIDCTEKIFSNSEKETTNMAKKITVKALRKNIRIFLLDGEMGSGKTHFAKGIAEALEIKSVIKSPTYTYMYEYKIGSQKFNLDKLIHFDAWRINSKIDLETFNIKRILNSKNVVIIEWPQILSQISPEIFRSAVFLYVEIKAISKNKRRIRLYYPKL